MRVAVTGATGNVGTSLLDRLAAEDRVTSIVAVARRLPDPELEAGRAKVTWTAADAADDDLLPDLEGVDVLVHLALALPSSSARPRPAAAPVPRAAPAEPAPVARPAARSPAPARPAVRDRSRLARP